MLDHALWQDYRLLRSMNLAAAERYSEMAASSAGLVSFAEGLQAKCVALMPQLAQIDVLDAQVCASRNTPRARGRAVPAGCSRQIRGYACM